MLNPVTGSPQVLVEQRGETRWIRLNNPRQRNAYDRDMAIAIAEAVESASEFRSVVITGVERSFCAGGMLAADAITTTTMRSLYSASLRLFDAIRLCPRPVIAAVNGPAAGGGNELVVACDLAIAAESATFGQTGPRVGSAPVTGATNVMSVQIGEKRAKELSMLCRRYTAAQAYAMGLVNAVVPDDDLEAETEKWCTELAVMSPRYLEIAKVSSNIWWNSARDSFNNGIGMLVQAIGSPDQIEGVRAFKEKRRPKFELSENT